MVISCHLPFPVAGFKASHVYSVAIPILGGMTHHISKSWISRDFKNTEFNDKFMGSLHFKI